jgi:hypothetical protein
VGRGRRRRCGRWRVQQRPGAQRVKPPLERGRAAPPRAGAGGAARRAPLATVTGACEFAFLVPPEAFAVGMAKLQMSSPE